MTEIIPTPAECHVEEAEECVTQQKVLVKKLEKEGSDILAVNEKLLLTMMERRLALVRDYLRNERKP